jgi:osmoprotectant transport system substrate-binding protein
MNLSKRRRPVALLAGLAMASSLVSACGLESSNKLPFEVAPGSIEQVSSLRDLPITVGSKNFTENIVLGYITQIALAAAGADINDLTNIQGSPVSRQALEGGDIDIYWEYTGTSWITYHGETEPIPDEEKLYQAVKELDERDPGIRWLDYSPVNDKYAFAVKREFAEEHGLKTTTDLVELVRQQPEQATFCLESEFIGRQDGLIGWQKTYGYTVPDDDKHRVKLGTGAIYDALNKGQSCNVGEVFTTDGRIEILDLVVMEDDKAFFPQYNAAPTMRTDFADQHPEIAEILNPISAKLNNDVMLELNARVDGDGADPAFVARDWLVDEGFVTIPKD